MRTHRVFFVYPVRSSLRKSNVRPLNFPARNVKGWLLIYLLHGLDGAPLGPDDMEVNRREAEMDSGKVEPTSLPCFSNRWVA